MELFRTKSKYIVANSMDELKKEVEKYFDRFGEKPSICYTDIEEGLIPSICYDLNLKREQVLQNIVDRNQVYQNMFIYRTLKEEF
jgi:hypothetical protein